MPALPVATFLRGMQSGHDECPPVPNVNPGQSKLLVNGVPAIVVGAMWGTHGCEEHDPHNGFLTQSDAKLFVDGVPVGRLNDKLDCQEEPTIIDADSKLVCASK